MVDDEAAVEAVYGDHVGVGALLGEFAVASSEMMISASFMMTRALAARERHTALADDGGEAVRQRCDGVVPLSEVRYCIIF